jgi:hypothetical protein
LKRRFGTTPCTASSLQPPPPSHPPNFFCNLQYMIGWMWNFAKFRIHPIILGEFCKIFIYNLCQNAFGEISLKFFAKFRKINATKFHDINFNFVFRKIKKIDFRNHLSIWAVSAGSPFWNSCDCETFNLKCIRIMNRIDTKTSLKLVFAYG